MSDSTMPRPTSNDHKQWKVYWKAQGEPWRTEPEILPDRQHELTERRDTISPDIGKGVYSFKDVRLSRADVEWLLHEHSPIDWNDETQHDREGLDLRGAILSGKNLSYLPLSNLRGGLYTEEILLEAKKANVSMLSKWSEPIAALAAIHLENANLSHCAINGAVFQQAFMDGINLSHCSAIGIILYYASLNNSNCDHTNFQDALLEEASFIKALLNMVDFSGASCSNCHFEAASIDGANMQRTNLAFANLSGAKLYHTSFDADSDLEGIILADKIHGNINLIDVRWGDADLTTIDWSVLKMLGDETDMLEILHQRRNETNSSKGTDGRARLAMIIISAYRKLSMALRNNGLNEDADRFAYRSAYWQRRYWRFQKKYLAYEGSLLLDLISGYGYRPARSMVTYALCVSVFAAIYGLLGLHSHPLSPLEAAVISMTAFHGRGFFASSFSPGDPQALVAAIEAFVGLFIEVTFIATFTQRFFSR